MMTLMTTPPVGQATPDVFSQPSPPAAQQQVNVGGGERTISGKVEWDAEIINDEPDSLIAWRSLGGADVDNAGSVRLVDRGDRGTEVHVVIDYIPPAGRLGKWVAKLFGEEPQQQIKEDLRIFKRVMETGEVPTIEGQPRGTCGGTRE